MSLKATSFIGGYPSLTNTLTEHVLEQALMRNLHSHVRKGKIAGLSRSGRRKVANRRRRWFVDNIIMHHKRLHDKNRQVAVDAMRKKALEKREALKKRQPTLTEALSLDKGPLRWRDKLDVKERSQTARDRIHCRKSRAQSRWLSVKDDLKSSSGS
jgi:hypothetical protein